MYLLVTAQLTPTTICVEQEVDRTKLQAPRSGAVELH